MAAAAAVAVALPSTSCRVKLNRKREEEDGSLALLDSHTASQVIWFSPLILLCSVTPTLPSDFLHNFIPEEKEEDSPSFFS